MLVTLDAEKARRVTTDALAALHHRWREALDQGLPGALAREAVLTAAVAATRPPAPAAGGSTGAETRGSPPDDVSSPGGAEPGEEAGDPVVLALVDVLRAATPLQRAVMAGGHVWSLLPAEVAALLGEPVTPVVQASSALRAALGRAHDAAREAVGLAAAEWALERDLDDALDVLLEGQGDPPDPAALVEERRRSVRRRSVLLGGVVTLSVGAAGWWLVHDATETSDAASGAAATTPGPTDISWDRTSSWSARGDLARDPGVQALVLGRTTQPSRLIWADDVGSRRVVVAAALDPSEPVGTSLRAWQGPRGADPTALGDVPLTLSSIAGVNDVVALTLPNGDDATSRTSLVIVLSHPTERHASYSTLVVPTPEGRVERRWTQLPLQEGLAATVVNRPLSPATRVRVGAYDGPPVTPDPLWLGGDAADANPTSFTSAVHAYVQRATGIPAWRLHTEVVADSPVNGSVLDPVAVSATGGDGRVVALLTRTPGGGVLSSVIVTDDGRDGGNTAVVRPVVLLPADRADDPVVERVGDERDGVARFLVVAPGAARVQLVSTAPNAHPISKVVATKGRTAAVVPVIDGADAMEFRVVARDGNGKVIFDDAPASPQFLLDLW